MSANHLPDNEADLVTRVTPASRAALMRVFTQAGASTVAAQEDVDRLIRVIGASVFEALSGIDDARLHREAPRKAKAAQKAARELAAQIEALTSIDPFMIDETPFPEFRRGRLSVFLHTLDEVDITLGRIAAQFSRNAQRPKLREPSFQTVCRIWLKRFGKLPPFSHATSSPLVEAMRIVASDMARDSRATASFTSVAFERARLHVGDRVKTTRVDAEKTT